MFPQTIRSTHLDTPCLQQSRKKKTHYDYLFFEKNITRRVRRRFHEANTVGVPCKRAKHCCATLRCSQNNRNVGTCWAKSLTSFKLYATSADKCQHCCGSMQTDATSHNRCCWPTMLRPFAWALRTLEYDVLFSYPFSSVEASKEANKKCWGPRNPHAPTILFPSPPIYSVLSLALHSPLKKPRELLRWREVSYPDITRPTVKPIRRITTSRRSENR